MRKMSDGREIPVIALSSFPALDMQGRAYAAGCRHYLEKTASSPLDVLHKVEDVLGRPPLAGEGATPWMLSYPTSKRAGGGDALPKSPEGGQPEAEPQPPS